MRLAVLALIASCGGHAATPDAPDSPTPPDAAAATDWDSVTVVANHGSYVVERVVYHAGGLAIVGQVCRPSASGAHPVIVFDHGGFSGLGAEWDGALCAGAANGYVIAMSSYRGEDGSEGAVEVCLGEVDDALAMMSIVRTKAYADAAHVGLLGGSHGGCVLLRSLTRGAQVVAAADLFGVTDWAAADTFWHGQLVSGTHPELASVFQSLIATIEGAAGGPPANVPAAYAARSPSSAPLATTAPLFVGHGVDDLLVPASGSCGLVAAAGGVTSLHVTDVNGTVTQAAPPGCGALSWSAGPLPRPAWPATRYLVEYDGAGHALTNPMEQEMQGDALAFLIARL